MLIPNGTQMIILVIVSLLLCCMGFKRFVWFMSVGYGLSSAGIGLTSLILALCYGGCSAAYVIFCLLFVIYGVRLGGFLLLRELKNEKYKAKVSSLGVDMKVPVFVAVVMWIFCGILYIFQTSPLIYRLGNDLAARTDVGLIIGILISAAGIAIEAIADKQKSAQKALNPNMPAMTGLFKMCRCPNYFGEILFWTGVFVSGIGAVQGVQWIAAVFGYVCIVGIMLSGGKRLETRHIKAYGKSAEYNHYADTTPLIIPLIPLYHVTNPEKIREEEAKKAAKKAAKKQAKSKG